MFKIGDYVRANRKLELHEKRVAFHIAFFMTPIEYTVPSDILTIVDIELITTNISVVILKSEKNYYARCFDDEITKISNLEILSRV